MVGRRMTSGGSTYMPLRVNMAGVIPVIFAVAVLFFPPTLGQIIPGLSRSRAGSRRARGRRSSSSSSLVVVFTFFYTAVTFNPTDQADNLKKHGGFIPGVRPGGRRRATSTACSPG